MVPGAAAAVDVEQTTEVEAATFGAGGGARGKAGVVSGAAAAVDVEQTTEVEAAAPPSDVSAPPS